MFRGGQFKFEAFNRALARRIATSTKSARVLLAEQIRAIIKVVIAITPPGHKGVEGGSQEADTHGRQKVESDIYAVYGTPRMAYALIAEQDELVAKAFWASKSKHPEKAALIVENYLRAQFGAFDGGALHKTKFVKGRLRARKSRVPFFIVDKARPLHDYILEKQRHVHWLGSGWREGALEVGAKTNKLVQKPAPSFATGSLLNDIVDIRADNLVEYASDTGLQTKLQWGIDQAERNMTRQWKAFDDEMNLKSGLAA